MDVLDATAPINVRFAALSRAVAVALHIDELETINVCSGECSFTCRFRVLLQYRAGTMHGGDESERIVPDCLLGAIETRLLNKQEIRTAIGAPEAPEGALIDINASYWGRFKIAAGAAPSRYPFDCYSCAIPLRLDRVKSGGSPDTRFSLLRLGGGWRETWGRTIRDASAISEEWTIHDPQLCPALDGVSGWKRMVELSFTAVRKPLVHLHNGFGLTVVLTAMNFGAFGIPADDVADRVQVPVTVALSIVALKLSLASSQPPSGVPNWQDTFMNSAVGFSLIAVAAFAAPARAAAALRAVGAEPTDAGLFKALLGAGAALCVLFFCAVQRERGSTRGALGPPLRISHKRAYTREAPFPALPAEK